MDMASFARHICGLVNTRISPKIRDSQKRAILAKMAKNGRILGRFGDPPNSMKFHKSARRRHGSPSAIPWRDLSGHESQGRQLAQLWRDLGFYVEKVLDLGPIWGRFWGSQNRTSERQIWDFGKKGVPKTRKCQKRPSPRKRRGVGCQN